MTGNDTSLKTHSPSWHLSTYSMLTTVPQLHSCLFKRSPSTLASLFFARVNEFRARNSSFYILE